MDTVVRKGFVEGVSTAPPSKSYTHRALFCSSLALGKSQIGFPLWSRDTEASVNALEKLGVEVNVKPTCWLIDSQGFNDSPSEIFCQESGTTLRFATAVSSLVNGETRITGGPSLLKRPIEPLIECLRQLGVECCSSNGYPPILVKGVGNITGGDVSIKGDISSQFVSAVLLIAPYADKPLTLKLSTPLESKPYVSMTIETQKSYGVYVYVEEDMRSFEIKRQSYKPSRFTVEGDWSSSAYLLAAGAL
ncbi:3-phosphoshikimate 1-carboxyvinyltransferase, partial [Candidatus Bathyarchaeota archaeon]|nr:3-phosphoshikimate 1-carboxyvinyltransferase [Candidatus Bathyarchaeota archaeon]